MKALTFGITLTIAAAAFGQSGNSGMEPTGAFMIAMRGTQPQLRSRGAAPSPFEVLMTVPADTATVSSREAARDPMNGQARHWLSTPMPIAVLGRAPSTRSPWDDAHAIVDNPVGELSRMTGMAESDMESMIAPADIMMVEPDVAIWDRDYARRLNEVEKETAPPPVSGNEVVVDPNGIASKAWPAGKDFAWHLGDDFSSLREARDKAAPHFDQNDKTNNVLVFHLDTGFYKAADHIRPKFLDKDLSISYLDAEGFPNAIEPGFDRFGGGFFPLRGHGSSTLSILAGNDVNVKDRDFDDYLGGAPFARVASCRISQSVVHFRPRIIVRAIEHAVQKDADLITMAAGSPPSQALADAVNKAYDNGVPMFFAASDFFKVPILPINVPPHTTVYPARFNRAVAVTGVTSAGKSYGLNSFWGFRRGIASWALRGSWGPARVMEHTVAAWAPNVAAQQAFRDDTPNVVKERFAGTSAATPQVAAAAALWMQTHKGELAPRGDWRRAEAVYQALFDGAKKGKSDPDPHFGRGMLDADATLALKVSDLTLEKRDTSLIGFDWLSAIAFLFKLSGSTEQRAAHMRMVNMELLQLWHSSQRLRKMVADPEESMSENAARRFVKAAAADERASEYLRHAMSF